MAHHKSAKKRIRNSARKRLRNRLFRSRARTLIKKAVRYIEAGDLESARQAAKEAISTLDKAANKGILHRNNVARRKSRLMKKLAALEASEGAGT